jgi:hypothetical protein
MFMSKIKFPFQKVVSQEILLELVEKSSQVYVLFALVESHSVTNNFDLWMSKRTY